MAPLVPELQRLWRHGRHEVSRRLRRPVEGRFQPYGYTLPDRYPWLFGFAREALRGVAAPRLLSFGCSTGEEVFSLRRYFPDAHLKGVDIDPRNIAACRADPRRDDGMQFETAAVVACEPSAAYDAVFCLAVLCHGDLTSSKAGRSDPVMRFEDFGRATSELSRCVRSGGYLFLHTTNFRFGDTAAAADFDVVLSARPDQIAGDLLFDRHNRLMPGECYLPVGFRKRGAAG